MKSLRKAGIVMLCALSLAACGEKTPAPPNANDKPAASSAGNVYDPCAVLTRDDIAAALGLQLDEAVHESFPRPNCRYGIGEGAVVVYVFADTSAKSGFIAGKNIQAAHSTAVTGLGNDAFWAPDLKVLNVLKGNVYFTVQFLGLRSASLEAAKALAHKVADRLP
jgi:predicted small lipoprotein YifL